MTPEETFNIIYIGDLDPDSTLAPKNVHGEYAIRTATTLGQVKSAVDNTFLMTNAYLLTGDMKAEEADVGNVLNDLILRISPDTILSGDDLTAFLEKYEPVLDKASSRVLQYLAEIGIVGYKPVFIHTSDDSAKHKELDDNPRMIRLVGGTDTPGDLVDCIRGFRVQYHQAHPDEAIPF